MAGPNRSNNPHGFAISGLLDEITSFTWKVSDFAKIMDLNSAINDQSYDFHAGDKIGMSSIWTVGVRRWNLNSEEWFGISMKLKERPSPNHQQFLAECSICEMDENGRDRPSETTSSPITDVYSTGEIQGWEFNWRIGPGRESDPEEGDCLVRVSLRLYGPQTAPNPNQAVEEMVKEFQIKSTAQARSDLSTLVSNPVTGIGNEIKIVTKEGTEHLIVMTGLLATRNPIFKAMLETQTVVINLPDMSAPTFQVLLHFLYTGDLRPEWKNSEVVVELTNAAAKYEIKELLEFLDSSLGRLCDLQNVGPLMALAGELDLKTAQNQLLNFIRRNGLSSPENFFEIVEGISAAKKVGEKRGHDDDDDDDAGKPDNKKSKGDDDDDD